MCPSSSSPLNNRLGTEVFAFSSSSPPSSLAIPLPSSHIQRTESELQLSEDMAAAEYRDYCMFNRLVSGIRKNQHEYYVRRSRQQHRMTPPAESSLSTNDAEERRKMRMMTPASVPPTKDGPGAYMMDSEQSIQNIILTRRSSQVQKTRTQEERAHIITPPCPMYGNTTNRRNAPETIAEDHDWSIEGFDGNASAPIAPSRTSKATPQRFPVLPALVPQDHPSQVSSTSRSSQPNAPPTWWMNSQMQTHEVVEQDIDHEDEVFDIEM